MSCVTARVVATALLGMTACAEDRQIAPDQPSLMVRDNSEETGGRGQTGSVSTLQGPPQVPAGELCSHVLEPSLAPLERPRIRPHNSFAYWESFRRRIDHVEVLDLDTNRVLFSLDEKTVEALREAYPVGRRIHWSGHSVRPDSLPAWNVAL